MNVRSQLSLLPKTVTYRHIFNIIVNNLDVPPVTFNFPSRVNEKKKERKKLFKNKSLFKPLTPVLALAVA